MPRASNGQVGLSTPSGRIDSSHYAGMAPRTQERELQSDNSADGVAMTQLRMPKWHSENVSQNCRVTTLHVIVAVMQLRMPKRR